MGWGHILLLVDLLHRVSKQGDGQAPMVVGLSRASTTGGETVLPVLARKLRKDRLVIVASMFTDIETTEAQCVK